MNAALKKEDWVEAAKEGRDSRWYHQVTKRAERLCPDLKMFLDIFTLNEYNMLYEYICTRPGFRQVRRVSRRQAHHQDAARSRSDALYEYVD